MNYLWLELIGSLCVCVFEFVQFTFSWKSHFTRSNRSQCLSTITALLALLLSSFSLWMLAFFLLLFFFVSTSSLDRWLWCFIDCYWIWLAIYDALRFHSLITSHSKLCLSVSPCPFSPLKTHTHTTTRSHPNHPPSSNFHNVPMCHGTLCIWYAPCAYVANESNVAEVMRYLTEKNYKTYK